MTAGSEIENSWLILFWLRLGPNRGLNQKMPDKCHLFKRGLGSVKGIAEKAATSVGWDAAAKISK